MNKRNTKQKAIIKLAIEGLYHPTAEEVLVAVGKIDASIGRATIFRALNEYVKEGNLLKLNFDKKVVYDTQAFDHDHFVCVKCNRIIDLDKTEVVKPPEKLHVLSSNITFYGICDECLKKEDK